MGRRALISEEELLTRICDVFRAKGYVGTSMSDLAAAAGLKKASLYHRFPGGKEQMAREVLAGVTAWFQEQVIVPLKSEDPVHDRFVRMGLALNAFYDDGHKACLFNRLSTGPQGETGPFHEEIEAAFAAWRNALIAALGDAGLDRQGARTRAVEALALIQGLLVYGQATGQEWLFRQQVKDLPERLLDGIKA